MNDYSFTVDSETLVCRIMKNSIVFDESGPWDTRESAETWASQITSKLNIGLVEEI